MRVNGKVRALQKKQKNKKQKISKTNSEFLKKNSETSSETSIVHGRESGRYIQMDFQKNKVRIFECQQQVLAVQKKKSEQQVQNL